MFIWTPAKWPDAGSRPAAVGPQGRVAASLLRGTAAPACRRAFTSQRRPPFCPQSPSRRTERYFKTIK